MLEKAAVAAGGGKNHRFSLGDGILIKDNHVAACGGVAEAVRRARLRAGAMLKIEVEVVDLPGLDAAIAAGAELVLLDNMDDATMAEAVRRARSLSNDRVQLEASGGMTLERLPRVAATGVDFVSMGAITHSAGAVDISFELG
jgi:nicotinate-nucleotide pyrophosphorylase (carboxylating)